MPVPRSPNTLSPPSFLTAGATLTSAATPTPLQTLVLNLRAQESENMTECADLADESALIREIQTRVDHLASTSLSPHDGPIAQALVSLIAQFNRLAELHPPSTRSSALPRTMSWGTSPTETAPPASHPLAQLQRQMTDLQLEREARGSDDGQSSRPPVQAVETALLWTRVDRDFDRILALCAHPTDLPEEDAESISDHLPPQYERGGYRDLFAASDVSLPMYEQGAYEGQEKAGGSSKTREQASASATNATGGMSDKMRMDLEAVALAIDRLYAVAPQLHDQRVELKKSKREQMERARMAGPSTEGDHSRERSGDSVKRKIRPGKEREREDLELDKMLMLIGKMSERKMVDQSVVLDGGMKARLEQAKLKDREKREAFVARLVRHSDAGRLHGQEAAPMRNKLKDPHAMLSLPEFMRESVPEGMRLKMQMEDSHAMLSLPEFVREPIPESLRPSPPPTVVSRKKSFRGLRSRSLSAPPLAWLLSTSPRSSSPATPSTPEEKEEKKETEKGKDPEKRRSILNRAKRPGSSSGFTPPPVIFQAGLDVHYVAEYHETLQHILVFLDVHGMTPGANLEAEVVPASDSSAGPGDERSRLLLKCGASTSPLLALPAAVPPGVKDVKVVGQYYEVKLTVNAAASSLLPLDAPPALLDATELSASHPSSFVCASCSLPLVRCAGLREYRDLPSEHWAELVDAWMCHADQKLHEHVKTHSVQGFWPREGEALVGGSYVLFEENAVVGSNLWHEESAEKQPDDDWRRTRCLCGAIIGRCQQRPFVSESEKAPMVYRFAKYAVRPMNANSGPSRSPLSAFIAEDMNEFVHAHATYRFVFFDEEEERPRILMWLFKPAMRLAYSVPKQYVIPKSGSIRAAKVLYKILDTVSTYSDLNSVLTRYPGFPQAEHLFYPRGICRRLGALLKESTTAYPENMRTMTGLDVGWLQRA
ncbi:HECT-like ubiquitin-conjugating enzyme-binding-domain-containing protein [Epithele typhae]|uniref:HECT-like ubiquitin-conjugating enzyme-binding-domain-containing protein n=1 Tax=Epithele typhae TaxID=378194 RepID=UPI0020075F9D|nr:HECT-like ubiquitin-conjugating enzyme-binding-domain-containing protein [Epithele typhae]KAH9941869.1 HECT-like ubiquitin-conjugating enzyme-binding-domain-containing protein [Epithele typhae]